MVGDTRGCQAKGQAAKQNRTILQDEAELRPKNQVTMPRAVVQALGLQPGDRLLFETREGEPGEVRVRRPRESYAGALAGTYGSEEETVEYLQAEREAWDE